MTQSSGSCSENESAEYAVARRQTAIIFSSEVTEGRITLTTSFLSAAAELRVATEKFTEALQALVEELDRTSDELRCPT